MGEGGGGQALSGIFHIFFKPSLWEGFKKQNSQIWDIGQYIESPPSPPIGMYLVVTFWDSWNPPFPAP